MFMRYVHVHWHPALLPIALMFKYIIKEPTEWISRSQNGGSVSSEMVAQSCRTSGSIGSVILNLCRRLAMNGEMHFILHRSKNLFVEAAVLS